MGNQIASTFKAKDVLRHKKTKKTYLFLGRHKGTAWLATFDTATKSFTGNRTLKVKTVNFCYELDTTWEILYGNARTTNI